MKTMTGVLAVLVLAAGCAVPVAGPEAGTWEAVIGQSPVCVSVVDLGKTAESGPSFALTMLCGLADGISAQIYAGWYEDNGSTLEMHVQRSSCPDQVRSLSVTYDASRDTLMVADGPVVVSYGRSGYVPGNLPSQTGCFLSGVFEPRAVAAP